MAQNYYHPNRAGFGQTSEFIFFPCRWRIRSSYLGLCACICRMALDLFVQGPPTNCLWPRHIGSAIFQWLVSPAFSLQFQKYFTVHWHGPASAPWHFCGCHGCLASRSCFGSAKSLVAFVLQFPDSASVARHGRRPSCRCRIHQVSQWGDPQQCQPFANSSSHCGPSSHGGSIPNPPTFDTFTFLSFDFPPKFAATVSGQWPINFVRICVLRHSVSK